MVDHISLSTIACSLSIMEEQTEQHDCLKVSDKLIGSLCDQKSISLVVLPVVHLWGGRLALFARLRMMTDTFRADYYS